MIKISKLKIIEFLVLSFFVFSIIACDVLDSDSDYTSSDNTSTVEDISEEEEENQEPIVADIDSFFWGTWQQLDKESEWVIKKNAVDGVYDYFDDRIEVAPLSADVNEITTRGGRRKYAYIGPDLYVDIMHKFEKVPNSDSILKVSSWDDHRIMEDNPTVFYLHRQPSSSFSGNLASQSSETASRSSQRGFENLGGIRVILQHGIVLEDTASTETDSNGDFTFDDIRVDEPYIVSIEEANIETDVEVEEYDDDIGTLTETASAYNLKTWISTSEQYNYHESTFDIQIHIENIGETDCTGATYFTTLPPLLTHESGKLQDILGTIEPNVEKIVNLTLTSGTISDYWETPVIEIKIVDLVGNEWYDHGSLRVYREKTALNVSSLYNDSIQGTVSGFYISSKGNKTWFKTSNRHDLGAGINYGYNAFVPIGLDYTIVISGATAATESSYSIGIGALPATDMELDTFLDIGSFEPNDHENQAANIFQDGNISSYIHKNDIDVYTVSVR